MQISKAVNQSTGLAKRQGPKAPVPHLVVASLLIVLLAACTMPSPAVTVPTTETQATTAPAPPGILGDEVQPTTFDQVKEAIDKLYSGRPDINSFVAKGVTYTPETRDKVLKICHEGGLVSSEAERESQEVLACAPLIFFFYNYGQQSGVPESINIARLLYWYTVANHSSESKKVLTELLQGWGIK